MAELVKRSLFSGQIYGPLFVAGSPGAGGAEAFSQGGSIVKINGTFPAGGIECIQ